MSQTFTKKAEIYRMVMADHICPYGLKSKDLLERKGFVVEDHHLKTRDETDSFKKKHGVSTTPQTWIDDKRIGGYDDLRKYFGDDIQEEGVANYYPVIVIFCVSFLMALAISWNTLNDVMGVKTLEWFIAFAMCVLAVQKLQDIESFSTTFLNYDLLARKWVRYSYLYPFGEALAGILMISDSLHWLSSLVALFIGSLGAISVIKAVYIDKRELKCACVGGNSTVPLGFISLLENVMMIGMGIWMIIK